VGELGNWREKHKRKQPRKNKNEKMNIIIILKELKDEERWSRKNRER
jgi:hypothetical protein